MQLQLIILSDLGFHAHLQLQWHDREQHTEGPLGLQQRARPALGAWKQSLQTARKEILRLRNINCTGPKQVCLEDFHGGSQSAPQISSSGLRWAFVIARPRLSPLNEALEGGPAV